MAEYLTLDIKYNIKNDSFKVYGNIRKERRADVIEAFLISQSGKERDGSKILEREEYKITLTLNTDNNAIDVRSDTGNNGLRNGILWHFCGRYCRT